MLRRLTVLFVAGLLLMLIASGCGEDKNSGPFIGNKNTKKFHLESCSYLPDQANRISISSCEQADREGYSPCEHCDPCSGKALTAPSD